MKEGRNDVHYIKGAAEMVADLHGRSLRLAALKTGQHFEGLHAVAAWLRRASPTARDPLVDQVRRKLRILEDATALIRHITSVS